MTGDRSRGRPQRHGDLRRGHSGTVALVVTRAIAPVGAFTSAVPMPEGITIDPGTFLHQSVTFKPTAVGPASGRYILNGNDGLGPVTVTITGTGTRSTGRTP